MFTTHEFSYLAILGAADLEARYATILVVLATTAMICYAFFMTTSRRYHLIPHRPSPFPTRTPPQATHGTREPLPEKGVPVDLFPHTCSEHPALAEEPDGTLGVEVVAEPIVESQASFEESEPQEVAGRLPPSQPGAGPDARPESDINVSGPVGRNAAESSEPEPSHTDDTVADLPLAVHLEVELGAGSLETVEEPRVVETQEMVCATPRHVSDDSGSEDSQTQRSVTVPASPPAVSTPEPADDDASMLMEAPFLLAADSRRSVGDEATLGAERLTEDGAIAGPEFVPSPCSQSDSPHDEVSSSIMHSVLLVPSNRVIAEDESSLQNAVGLDAEDDWTSIDPDEPSTPRLSSLADLRPALAESAKATPTGENDLAASAVLLTQSQYASVMLFSNATDNGAPPSPISSPPSQSARPRVHTSDQPDWAIAPQAGRDDVTRERTQRRHSIDSPDWAVAPEDTAGGARKKGRKSDPGSGRRKKPRRAWASR